MLNVPAPAALDGFESPIRSRFGGLTTPLSMASPSGISPCKRGVVSSPLKRARGTSFAGLGASLLREPCWSPQCEEGSPKKQLASSRSRVASEVDGFSVLGVSCRTPHASDSVRKTSFSIPSSIISARPLPQSDIDWLMNTLSKEEVSRFNHRYFVNDCKRRFGELDGDSTGLLGLEKLQDGLVDMFPTLKLELRVEGHHIPALDKSVPSLIATFDADADGYLDFDDFVKFIKFQQAWRAQFFLSRSQKLEALPPLRESTSLARLGTFPELPSPAGRPQSTASRRGSLSKKKLAKRGSSTASSTSLMYITDLRPSSSSTSRPSSCSTRASSRGTLDSSRGAFYSSLMGLSSPIKTP